MCEKVLLGLLLVRSERSLEDLLEVRLGGSCSCGWRCGYRGHDERRREYIVSAGQRAHTALQTSSSKASQNGRRAPVTIDAHVL